MVLNLFLQAVPTGNPFKEFFSNPGSFIKLTDVLAKSIGVAEGMVALFFMTALCYNYVNTFIKEGHKGKFYDPADLKRTLVVALLIPIIPGIFYLIETLGLSVAGAFELSAGEKMEAIGKINQKMTEITELEAFSVFDMSMTMLLNALGSVLMFLNVMFMYIIRFVVMLITGVLIKFLIVISPIACAFSILPFFKDQMLKLLSIFFNACFVIVTLNILAIV